MKAQHTATPWRIGFDNANNILVDAGGIYIASTEGYNINANSEANAAHIVKCVNTHDALISTLEAVKNYLYTLEETDENEAMLLEVNLILLASEASNE
jgi:hypothetical protein